MAANGGGCGGCGGSRPPPPAAAAAAMSPRRGRRTTRAAAAVAGAALPVLLLGLLCLVQLRGSSRLVTWRGGGGDSYDFSQQSRGGGGEQPGPRRGEGGQEKRWRRRRPPPPPRPPRTFGTAPPPSHLGLRNTLAGTGPRGAGSPDKSETRRYLVLRCLEDDAECGGASDRLGPLPYLLMLAHRARRLLFIHWSRPAPLEEFLVPPAGGMDWTVPECVRFNLTGAAGSLALAKANATWIVVEPGNAGAAAFGNLTVVQARFRGLSGGVWGRTPDAEYDAYGPDAPSRQEGDSSAFEAVYGEAWRVLFEPSPAVASLVQEEMGRSGLAAGAYAAAHVRARYSASRNLTLGGGGGGDGGGGGRDAAMEEAVANAIRCALSLLPGAPAVYLAGDSPDVARYGLEYGSAPALRNLTRVVVASALAPGGGGGNAARPGPLHLDRGRTYLSLREADWRAHRPGDYYGTFVDLYLLSRAACASTGWGGYGRWAHLVGRGSSDNNTSSTCAIRHTETRCALPPPRRPRPPRRPKS